VPADGRVNVGLHLDLRNPRPWRQDPARLHAFTLELAEEADRLGVHSIWLSEHHRAEDDYLASPLTFASAIAARTKKLRIGTAIMVAPLHHPVEIAEQAALVDLVSDGRLDLGLGAGYRLSEYELFGETLERKYSKTDERVRQIRRLWEDGGVAPRPVQAPLPIWLGYQGPQGARRAGLLGEGLLCADGRLWEPYRDGLLEAGHDLGRARMAGSVQGWVSEDPEKDWPTVSRHLAYQLGSYAEYALEGSGRAPRPIDTDALRQRDADGLKYFWCETPETMAQRVRGMIGDSPTRTVFFWASLAGMPEDWAARHVQTLCEKLAPLLAGPTGTNED